MIEPEQYALRGFCEDQALEAWGKISWFCDHMPADGVHEVYRLIIPQEKGINLIKAFFKVDFGNLGERNLLRGVLRGMEIIEISQKETDKIKRRTDFLVWVTQLN